MKIAALLLVLVPLASPVIAAVPQIESVVAEKSGMGWRFSVTMSHPDTGWDHFADGWEVIDSAGNVLGHRELMHPHETEQPFTRSLNAVMVPDGIREVFIRARCSVEGWSGKLHSVPLSPGG